MIGCMPFACQMHAVRAPRLQLPKQLTVVAAGNQVKGMHDVWHTEVDTKSRGTKGKPKVVRIPTQSSPTCLHSQSIYSIHTRACRPTFVRVVLPRTQSQQQQVMKGVVSHTQSFHCKQKRGPCNGIEMRKACAIGCKVDLLRHTHTLTHTHTHSHTYTTYSRGLTGHLATCVPKPS